MRAARILLLGLSLCAVNVQAAEDDPARSLAKYPGLYTQFALGYAPGNRAFDAEGERGDPLPATGPGSELPSQRAGVALEWWFPWFEAAGAPFISSRLWTLQAEFGAAQLSPKGAIADDADSHGLPQKADGLEDLQLSFGPALIGSGDWRQRLRQPLSVVLLGQVLLPIGDRDAKAPDNVGGNVFAYGAQLGFNLRPASGWLVDASARWRRYGHNREPAYGAQEPARLGDQWRVDALLSRRLWAGTYLSVSALHRQGASNQYEQLRFSPNPPSAGPLYDSFPDPGRFSDDGTRLTEAGLSLRWFATPRLSLALHAHQPIAGRSGSFELPYLRQTQDCAGLGGCNPQRYGSDTVDGLGAARVDASPRFAISLSWQLDEALLFGADD